MAQMVGAELQFETILCLGVGRDHDSGVIDQQGDRGSSKALGQLGQGGLIRDVLAGNQTILMKKELYAVPLTIGTVVYVAALPFLPGSEVAVGIVCALLIFGIRAAAIHWDLSVPDWAIAKPKQED